MLEGWGGSTPVCKLSTHPLISLHASVQVLTALPLPPPKVESNTAYNTTANTSHIDIISRSTFQVFNVIHF